MTSWTVIFQDPLFTGFSQQEYCNRLPCPPSGDLPDPDIEPSSPVSPALAGRFFTTERPGKPQVNLEELFFFFFFLAASQKKLSSVCLVYSVLCLVTRSCLTLCNPMDYSPPGSSFHGILQERILEWVAIPFSRGSYWPSDWTQISCISSRFSTVWVTREALVYTVSNQMIF